MSATTLFHDDKFVVRKLMEDDKHETMELMKQHFIDDYVLKYIPGIQPQDVEDYLTSRFDKCVKQGYSFAIFEKSSKAMVATTLNYIRRKFDLHTTSDQNLSPALQYLAIFMQQLEKNLFELLKCDKVFDIGINTTVHAAYRTLGLLTLIAQSCFYLSQKTKCEYMTVRPTTEYLIKGYEHENHYILLNEILYADFIDPVTKKKPFANAKFPHVRAQLYFVKIKEVEVKPLSIFAKL